MATVWSAQEAQTAIIVSRVPKHGDLRFVVPRLTRNGAMTQAQTGQSLAG